MKEDFEQVLSSVKDEVTRLSTEVAELRKRLSLLEEERAEQAAESVEASF